MAWYQKNKKLLAININCFVSCFVKFFYYSIFGKNLHNCQESNRGESLATNSDNVIVLACHRHHMTICHSCVWLRREGVNDWRICFRPSFGSTFNNSQPFAWLHRKIQQLLHVCNHFSYFKTSQRLIRITSTISE